ncbi:glycosyltransferase family 39 protein [Comamonas humi]
MNLSYSSRGTLAGGHASRADWHPLALSLPLVLLLSLAWLAALAWVRPLSNPDEGRYVGVALDMLRTGDWLTPRLAGMPFFHKPPLFYWICAAGLKLFGVHEWVGRLPSLLGASMAATGVYGFLRAFATERLARLAWLVLLTTPLFYLGAQYANMDMLVAGCMAVTVLLGAAAALRHHEGLPWRGLLAGAYAFAGVTFLAKGLIGFVLPVAVLVLWSAWGRRWRQLQLLLWSPGWVVALAVVGPWMWVMQRHYPQFWDYFIVTQHFRRFTQSSFNNHQPLWFYPGVILIACLPWTVLLVSRRLAGARRLPALNPVDRLMVVWAVVVVGFFSLPQSKLVGYILPALPPLAYLLARLALWRFAQPQQAGVLRRWVAGAAFVCAALAVVLGTVAAPQSTLLRPLRQFAVQPEDKLVMLDGMAYGLPFYLRVHGEPYIYSQWNDPDIARKDNWKKELSDAAGFAAPEQAAHLIGYARLRELVCSEEGIWVAASGQDYVLQVPELAALKPVFRTGDISVWHAPQGQVLVHTCP